MADQYVRLIGAEDIGRAGQNISSAASDIHRAASIFDSTANQLMQFMDDWLSRFQSVSISQKENKIIKIGKQWIDLSLIISISDIEPYPDLPPTQYGIFYVVIKFNDKPISFFSTTDEVKLMHKEILQAWLNYQQKED